MRKKKQTPIFRKCPPANFFVKTTAKSRVLPPVRFDSRQAEMASLVHATACTDPETGWFAMKPGAPADPRMEIHVA